MELAELTAYAKEKYQMEEMHKWAGFPGFSVLCHPQTGQWIALLMRQWDSDSGMTIERCDLKCGVRALSEYRKPYLSSPIRMQGSKWIGISFGRETEAEVILALFDRAVALGNGNINLGNKIVALKNGTIGSGDGKVNGGISGIYRDTVLPKPSRRYAQEAAIPARIHEMQRLYEYGRESMEARARNFYRQAAFMQDYEDDYPWSGSFEHYYPTYHDMTSRQLRGYFSWRTQVRRGEYRELPASAACVYIFELINGIGIKSPLDGLEKMKEFERAYLRPGLGGQGLFATKLKRYIAQWMQDYCIVKRVSPEIAMNYMPQLDVDRSTALSVLKSPENVGDEGVFSALCGISSCSLSKSSAYKKDRGRTAHLVAESWRKAASQYTAHGRDLFTLCFGRRVTRHWYPFSNAVYYWEAATDAEKDFSYEINGCVYRCKDGGFKVSSYESINFDLKRIKSFLHEADHQIRAYLKSGRYLIGKPEGEWAAPFIKAAIEDDRRAAAEAAKPKITIDLSGLERIRQEANATRDSLLTDEERRELEEYSEYSKHTTGKESDRNRESKINIETGIHKMSVLQSGPDEVSCVDAAVNPRTESSAGREINIKKSAGIGREDQTGQAGGLSSAYTDILRILFDGGSPDALIREKHLMPSIVADAINEALFDEIGDIVITCEDDRLSLVEEYEADLADLFQW